MKSLASGDVLSETRGRLLKLRADDAARWGKMTATQMVRHLSCAYEIALGERNVEPIKGPPPALLKWVALRSGLRWPKNVPATPELALAISEDPGVEFQELINAALEKIEAVASRTRYEPKHPMFGPMAAEDWMRWGYLHADHHLRQFGR